MHNFSNFFIVEVKFSFNNTCTQFALAYKL